MSRAPENQGHRTWRKDCNIGMGKEILRNCKKRKKKAGMAVSGTMLIVGKEVHRIKSIN